MTQLSTACLAMQNDSQFSKMYASGTMKKTEYWKYIYEDALDLIAKLPVVAAFIYKRSCVKEAARKSRRSNRRYEFGPRGEFQSNDGLPFQRV